MQKGNSTKIIFKKIFPYILIILIGFSIYYKTLFFDFTYLDDNVLILNNLHFLSNLSNIFQSFKQEVFHMLHQNAAYYRPILTISFMLDAQLGNTSAFVYHFTNIIIHLLASCLILWLLIKLRYDKQISLFFALIFTVHPVLAQAVAWLPGRNDSLLAVFVILAFISFLNFLEKKKWKYYLLHLFFFAIAVFTKETALALILICMSYLQFIKKEKPFSFNEKILATGWLAVAIFWFLARSNALSAESYQLKITFFEMAKSVLVNLPAVIQFVGKVFLPFNLSVFPIIQDTTFIYGSIAVATLVCALVFAKHRRNNFIVFGLSWFLFFLLPAFIRPAGTMVVDFLEHRVYLPIAGIFFLLLEVDLIKQMSIFKKKTLLLCFLVLTTLICINFTHTDNFKNKLSFWKNAATTSPHSPLVHRNLGAMYYLNGFLDKAEDEYKRSLELNPYEPQAHNNLGLIYMDKGMFQAAEEEYKKELKLNPHYDDLHFNLGLLYYKQGKLKDAEYLWRRTVEINPDYIDALNNLAVYYYEQRDYERADYYIKQLHKRGVETKLPDTKPPPAKK